MAGAGRRGWIVAPFALLLSISIAGIGSAWLGGSARIPFVAGLDSYMPAWMARIHPQYRHALRGADRARCGVADSGASEFCRGGRAGNVSEAAVAGGRAATGAVPLYVWRAAEDGVWTDRAGYYSKTTLIFAGVSGFMTTILGIALAFFPAQQITSLLSYEMWMFGGTLFFIGLAAFFFFVYGGRKMRRAALAASAVSPSAARQIES